MMEVLNCDAPGCGHVEPVREITEAMVGMPCPKCGADLLTMEDWRGWQAHRAVLQAAEALSKQIGEGDGMMLSLRYHNGAVRIEADGQDVTPSKGTMDIVAERRRQIIEEGWTAEKDDTYNSCGELARAAACYAMSACHLGAYRWPAGLIRELWPFADHWWKPKGDREDLVRAGALIIAEIDRLDRAEARRAKE